MNACTTFHGKHPIIVEIYQSGSKLRAAFWESPTFLSCEPRQASAAKNNSRIKPEQIVLNDPFLSLANICPPSLPLTMALCGLSLILFHGTIRYICFSASDRLDFHLRIHHLQKGCLYLPSILAGLYYSLSACLHSWCQVLTDASSFPLSNASHFSVSVSVFFLSYYYLPRVGNLWRRSVCATARLTAI